MKLIAVPVNGLGRILQSRGRNKWAETAYATACRIAPRWNSPWFNRGLISKFERRWTDSQRFNQVAAELDPLFLPAWWNLGIAATANRDWQTARLAWTHYGLEVPEGDGPLVMNLGPVPIRIDPRGKAEVVWCARLDPARAQIVNIPFPDSGHAYFDTVLNDGEPLGYREYAGQQIPVFNELELFEQSSWSTYSANLSIPDPEAFQALSELAQTHELALEDWSTVRMLCAACSEGIPHEHDTAEDTRDWQPARKIGIAARALDDVQELLNAWSWSGQFREVGEIECVLNRS